MGLAAAAIGMDGGRNGEEMDYQEMEGEDFDYDQEDQWGDYQHEGGQDRHERDKKHDDERDENHDDERDKFHDEQFRDEDEYQDNQFQDNGDQFNNERNEEYTDYKDSEHGDDYETDSDNWDYYGDMEDEL